MGEWGESHNVNMLPKNKGYNLSLFDPAIILVESCSELLQDIQNTLFISGKHIFLLFKYLCSNIYVFQNIYSCFSNIFHSSGNYVLNTEVIMKHSCHKVNSRNPYIHSWFFSRTWYQFRNILPSYTNQTWCFCTYQQIVYF